MLVCFVLVFPVVEECSWRTEALVRTFLGALPVPVWGGTSGVWEESSLCRGGTATARGGVLSKGSRVAIVKYVRVSCRATTTTTSATCYVCLRVHHAGLRGWTTCRQACRGGGLGEAWRGGLGVWRAWHQGTGAGPRPQRPRPALMARRRRACSQRFRPEPVARVHSPCVVLYRLGLRNAS